MKHKTRKVTKVIVASIVAMVVLSHQASASANQKDVSNLLALTCGGLDGELQDVRASLRHAVHQEVKDEPLLVKMENNYVYLSPKDSVTFYQARQSYLHFIKQRLGCRA